MQVKVVGPCAAGKSTLRARLRARGVEISMAAQEHSAVPDLWQRRNPPDVLLYLDLARPETANQRLGRRDWTVKILETQAGRLAHARAHADFYLVTDDLTPAQVEAKVLQFLEHADMDRTGPEAEATSA
jgi:deoxyadenosine/deoxycytidine kinase